MAAGQQIKEEIIKLNTKRIERNALSVAIASLVVLLLCAVAGAQSSSINGVINSRNGPSMGVQTQNSGTVTVLLTDATQVEEPEGVFRKKHYSMVALVPHLKGHRCQRQDPQQHLSLRQALARHFESAANLSPE